jgi:Zn-dependent protease with chaperone function
MVIRRLLLAVLFAAGNFSSNISAEGIYCEELAVFKAREDMKAIFNEDMHSQLRAIQRDISTYKKLSFLQRLVRGAFLSCDVILVEPDTMPALYSYVDTLCTKAKIATPTIFLTREESFFNAFAQKLFASTGGILIGQKLLLETSDEELEAIVAHEIGHIKHDHVNKMLALSIFTYAISNMLLSRFTNLVGAVHVYYAVQLSSILSALIINKKFEKEADAFACEVADRGKGVVEFFEHLQKKEQIREEEFVSTADLLAEGKSQIAGISYVGLCFRYYMAQFGHEFTKMYKYIYHNTPLGAHPSNEARIAAAQEYLAKQQ